MHSKLVTDKERNDDELFGLIQQGDKEAFTVVYKKYHKQLYILAFSYLKDKHMAEDVIQHVFTKLWEYRTDLFIKVNIKNFLYTITKNHILNTIRDKNKMIMKNYEIAQSSVNYDDNLFRLIEEKELKNIFRNALNLLPKQKKMICLFKMEGKLSNQEIADKMQISIHTVKTHYAQAIKLLRVHMDKMLIFVIIIMLLYT